MKVCEIRISAELLLAILSVSKDLPEDAQVVQVLAGEDTRTIRFDSLVSTGNCR